MTQTRIQDRPGEMNTYPCGCWIERDSAGQHHIHYCPMHAAAPALYEALEAVHATFERHNVPLPAYLCRNEEQIKAALAQAQGKGE